MKKQLLIAIYLLVFVNSYSQTVIGINTAKVYLDRINQNLASDKLYIRAVASTFSAIDPVNPTDIGEFTIAKNGNSSFQQFKGYVTYTKNNYAIQIDTTEKNIVLSDAGIVPYSKLDITELEKCSKITKSIVIDSKIMLEFKFENNSQYQSIEIVFDSTDFSLKKINMQFVFDSQNVLEMGIKKIEIDYQQIQNQIPESIAIVNIDDIIKLNRKNEVKIIAIEYKTYTIINLLKL